MFSTGMGDGGLLFALAMAAACFILMRRAARRISLQRRPSPPSRQSAETPGRTLLHGDAARSQIALYDLARDLQGEMESKSGVLQILIAQARTEADRLERLLAEKCDHDANLTAAAAPDSCKGAPIHDSHGVGATSSPAPQRGMLEGADEVYRQADAGESAQEIAASLARPLGDVELLLSLRP